MQLIIFSFFLIGMYYIKGPKRILKKHRLFMGIAVVLNAASIFLVMGRSFLASLGLMVESLYEFGPFVTWVHAITGGAAEICGATFLFKHPKKTRLWMRVTSTLWTISLLLGIVFYMYYYVT